MFGNSIFCKYAAIETFIFIAALAGVFAAAVILF